MSVALQVCAECGAVNYPAREVCRNCLGEMLEPTSVSGRGVLLARSILHASGDPFFRQRLPWRIGSVLLDAGATLIAHLGHGVGEPGETVEVGTAEQNGRTVFIAETAV